VSIATLDDLGHFWSQIPLKRNMSEAQTVTAANRMPGTCSHSMTGTISLLVLSHSWISRLEFSEKHTHIHMFIGAHMVKHAKAIKQKPYMVLYYFRVAINNG
jgi:hypothetical protein